MNRSSKDIVWAIFLIFVGFIFLLNTTGVVGWGIWTYILRFWPIFLILGGIKLIAGKSILAEVILSVVAVILFLFAGAISYISYTESRVSFLPKGINNCILGDCPGFSRGTVQESFEVSSTYPYENVNRRELDLSIGASKFTLTDTDTLEYFTADAIYPVQYSTPEFKSESTEEKLSIGFRSASFTGFNVFHNEKSEYEFVLGRKDMLTDLRVVLGAGDGSMVLDNILLGEVNSTVGAGRLTLSIGERSVPSEKIYIEVGAGEFVLELDESIGYTLEYDLGVGSITGDGKDIATFAGSEKEYESENYESSDLKVKIVANVGVGTLAINTK